MKIKAALVSVFDKTGLEPIIQILHRQGVNSDPEYPAFRRATQSRRLGWDAITRVSKRL